MAGIQILVVPLDAKWKAVFQVHQDRGCGRSHHPRQSHPGRRIDRYRRLQSDSHGGTQIRDPRFDREYLKDAQDPEQETTSSRNRQCTPVHSRQVRLRLCDSQVGDITLPKIQDWLIRLKEEGKAQDTCWGYGQRVRSFVKYLVSKTYLVETILTDFMVPKSSRVGRKNWIRKDNVTKLMDAANADPILKFALLCGFDAGLRRNEISEARVNWFDLENNLLHVMKHENFVPKDRDNRAIPLTDRFREFLKSYLAGRDGAEYVLAPEKTKKVANKYRYDTNKRVRSHFERCKIKASVHDMRRSFASTRVSAGTSIYKVARWLGDGIVVTERSYGHLEPQDDEINRGV